MDSFFEQAEPHSRAKHKILEEYLTRWTIILGKQYRDRPLLYVDGFSGAGQYDDKTPGSPLIAIKTVQNLCLKNPDFKIRMVFIEKNKEVLKKLECNLLEMRNTAPRNLIIDKPMGGSCNEEVVKLIEERVKEHHALGPSLFFLDQFGYSNVPMNLISRILKYESCEVLTYMNWNMLGLYIEDHTKHKTISTAFGGEEWATVKLDKPNIRSKKFRDEYIKALKEKAKAQFCCPFEMRDGSGRLIYWLFFCTRNIRGMEEMKKAMWKVDNSGGFSFSDKHIGQAHLFNYGVKELVDDIVKRFGGSECKLEDIHNFVISSTPHYKYKDALAEMEREGFLEVIKSPEGRKKGSFGDSEMRIKVRKESSKEKSLFD